MQCPKCQKEMNLKFSCTQLINGTMLAFLKLTKDYAITPDSRVFATHGTRTHQALEGTNDEYSLLEERFGGEQSDITGIADVIETENGRTILVDRKTMGSYKTAKCLGFYTEEIPTGEVWKSGKKKGLPKFDKILKRDEEHIDRWEYELQTNFYRMEAEKRGMKISEIRIEGMIRDGGTFIARSRGVFRNQYYFKISILPDNYVKSYFNRKAEALRKALKNGRCDTICSAKENWDGLRCERYCEVAEYCTFGKYLKKEKEIDDMPIKGLSEIRRLPRLGKIRLGIKEKNKSGQGEHPKEVPWFILDPSTPAKEENDLLIREFTKLYGENPTQIRIMFPVADPSLFFQQDYKRYGSSTSLKCKGDGETATCGTTEFAAGLKIIGKTELGNPRVECKGRECIYYKSKECSECGVLSVLLPELPGAGVWQIVTGSYHSIVNVNSGIDLIRSICGRAHMIPLTLERVPQETGVDGKKITHYILHINASFKLSEIQRLAQIDPEKSALALPEPEIEKEDIMFPETQAANGEPTVKPLPQPEKLAKAENSRSPEDNLFIDLIASLDSVSTKEQMTTWWESVKNASDAAEITKDHYAKLVIERNVVVQSKGWDKK